MKNISRLFFLAAAILGFVACDKVNDLKINQSSIAPILSVSTTTVATLPADSAKTALALAWTYPNHSVSDPNTIKYLVEIDSTGKSFAKGFAKIVTGSLSTSFTGKELNEMLLGYGYVFNVPVSMDIRVTSSYSNNNERTMSNTVKVMMTPYKVPPKVALPTSGKLFLVGNATQGGWTNPVPVPSQEFARLDETTFGGIFQLNGGLEYLVLPVNGDWGHKFSVADNTVPGLSQGGNFGFDLAQNFPAPSASGYYKIIVDFQSGKFTVTPYTGVLPNNLFIVGDATAGGWTNPVPVPSQQLTRINSSVFEITLNLTGGKEYLLLPVNGDWAHKYAVADNSITGLSAGGSFGYDLSKNFPAPSSDGSYKISVNFATDKFTVTKQ